MNSPGTRSRCSVGLSVREECAASPCPPRIIPSPVRPSCGPGAACRPPSGRYFGTLIGLAWQGRPFLGVMDHPVTGDRWCGVSGRFATHNGAPVRVRPCATMEDAFVTCSNPDFMSPTDQARFAQLRQRARYVQYGGSCFAYASTLMCVCVLTAGLPDPSRQTDRPDAADG